MHTEECTHTHTHTHVHGHHNVLQQGRRYISTQTLLAASRHNTHKIYQLLHIYSASWWWANKCSKPVEAINHNKLKANSATCWSYYTDILRCTVNKTLCLRKQIFCMPYFWHLRFWHWWMKLWHIQSRGGHPCSGSMSIPGNVGTYWMDYTVPYATTQHCTFCSTKIKGLKIF
jgi:hypothetical protein